MKKFLAIYKGSPNSNQKAKWDSMDDKTRHELTKKGIETWGAWGQKNKNAIVDQGAPLGKTKRIDKEGVSDVRNQDTAFVIIQAESHEAAAKIFLEHPHFSIFPGESVEVMEFLPMPNA